MIWKSPVRFAAVCLLAAALPLTEVAKAQDLAAAFQPPGMWIWDNWFAYDGQQWHAFYLQLPKAVGMERRWKNNDLFKHVGHAISKDLKTWQDKGPALTALVGTWNDRHIATGSIVRHDNQWFMLFTGRGTKGDAVGLAVSPDLQTWKTESEPLFPLIGTFDMGESTPAFKSTWHGKDVSWVGISDPYILPEKHDDWFHVVLCSRILGEPIATSGCLTILRSKDLRHWEQPQVLAWPRCFERMETPQVWRHGSQWHLTFGGVLHEDIVKQQPPTLPAAVKTRRTHQNYDYLSASLTQPRSDDHLNYIPTPSGHYIMKVLPAAPDQDLAIFTVTTKTTGSAMSAPFQVNYSPAGDISLEARP